MGPHRSSTGRAPGSTPANPINFFSATAAREPDQPDRSFSPEAEVVPRLRVRRPHRPRRAGASRLFCVTLV